MGKEDMEPLVSEEDSNDGCQPRKRADGTYGGTKSLAVGPPVPGLPVLISAALEGRLVQG
jgi:hypothetical protein